MLMVGSPLNPSPAKLSQDSWIRQKERAKGHEINPANFGGKTICSCSR